MSRSDDARTAFQQLEAERDSLRSRLQAAEAEREPRNNEFRFNWVRRSDLEQAKATIHELQEALERITRLPEHESQLWEHGPQREAATHALLWDAVRLARQALHPTQNEGRKPCLTRYGNPFCENGWDVMNDRPCCRDPETGEPLPMSDAQRDERIVRDRIVDPVPSTYGQDAFDRILSRLQTAEADKTEWRDLYEELHVKLEAAEALLDDATGSGATYYELQRRIHELQEALERAKAELGNSMEEQRLGLHIDRLLHPTPGPDTP